MLAFLLLFRIWIFWQEAGFGYEEEDSLHMRLAHWGYRILYFVLIFMAVSGLTLHWYELLGLSEGLTHTIKDTHELTAWAVEIFMPLHIAGVFLMENDDQPGIVSRMISG